MSTVPSVFDNSLSDWVAVQQALKGRLKYFVTRANLRRHLPSKPLYILDAGGGNGQDSIPFAIDGHHVTIVDYASSMLADATRYAAEVGSQDRVLTRIAELSLLPTIFPEPRFDVVFCHNVLQYVDDVAALLSSIVSPLKSGGIVSIISVNRHAIPCRTAFSTRDIDAVHSSLEQRTELATTFGVTMPEYTAEEVIDMLPEIGCVLEQHYGIRCIYDYWGDSELKSDPRIHEQLVNLELALTDRHPYKHLARFFQVVARKQ